MKKAIESLKRLPSGYDMVGFSYRGYNIYLKPYHTYLFFYIVDEPTKTVTILRVLHDGMNWKTVLKCWLQAEE